MNPVFILSSLLAVATAFPQDIPVVRPNHYLSEGTFQDPAGNKQHLLPESFFTPGQQVGAELKNLNLQQQTSPSQQQQSSIKPNVQTSSTPEGGQVSVATTSNAPATNSGTPDSYSNIGGTSGRGRVASALTNTNEYGETVPQAFSNLQQDSYAFYQGHQPTN